MKLPLFNWKEERWVRKNFHQDKAFKALDKELLDSPNPYPMAKVFPYGETPLRIFYKLGIEANLKPTDHFIDLGCGRGRGVFFMAHVFGCRATGIDLTPSFIARARKLAKTHQQANVQFLCQDFFDANIKDATCIYLYGTTYENELLERIQFPSGSKLFTVSAPLFNPHRSIHVKYPWGRSSIYHHEM